MDIVLTNWLLDSDPSIKWQVMQLLDYNFTEIQEQRDEMEKEGWATRILDVQQEDGSWGGGMYVPKFTSTTFSLLLLKRLGINHKNAQCQKGARLLFQGLRKDGGINFSPKENVRSETCITGMIFNLLTYFELQDSRIEDIFAYLIKNQMSDNGWNCKYPRDATHASFNTTLLVLEGLHSYKEYLQRQKKDVSKVEEIEEKGRDFLLQHKLYRSHTTGIIIRDDFVKFPFPWHWKYDLLTALDYFQASKARYDERLEDPIKYVTSKHENGYLNNYRGQSGKIWFTMETVGKPSKFNTLRLQRILKWWNSIKE